MMKNIIKSAIEAGAFQNHLYEVLRKFSNKKTIKVHLTLQQIELLHACALYGIQSHADLARLTGVNIPTEYPEPIGFADDDTVEPGDYSYI